MTDELKSMDKETMMTILTQLRDMMEQDEVEGLFVVATTGAETDVELYYAWTPGAAVHPLKMTGAIRYSQMAFETAAMTAEEDDVVTDQLDETEV